MNMKLFKILAVLLWFKSGRTEELMIPHKVSKTEVKHNQTKGIDVSHWQGDIDWVKVANSGVEHVFIKMSQGGSYADPKFVKNWNNALAAGLNVNCYHYFMALTSIPDQMKHIIQNLKLVNFSPAKNSLAIDVELKGNEIVTPKEMADNLNDLLNLLKKNYNVSSMIYTSPGFWESHVQWEAYDFSAYGLWVAHYGVTNPRIPEPWKRNNESWVWWQYSQRGKVNGIKGDVDLDWVKP